MSAADIMSVMFFREMQFDPSDPDNPANDRFVLSKGHAAPLLYAAFAEAGIFTVPQLATLRKIDSILEGHPTPPNSLGRCGDRFTGPGSFGSSGNALASRLEKIPFNTYVLMEMENAPKAPSGKLQRLPATIRRRTCLRPST
jgi:transketolase